MSLPLEIVDYIIDLTDFWTLQACSLVAKSWVARSWMHLFRAIRLISYRNWQKVIPVGPIGPAIHTRTLTVVQNSPPAERCVHADILDQFLPCLRDFKNVENLILRDWWESPPLSEDRLKKYFGHFSARLRSLELNGEGMSSDFFFALLISKCGTVLFTHRSYLILFLTAPRHFDPSRLYNFGTWIIERQITEKRAG